MIFRVTKQGVLRGILERERVARSVWWRGKEQDLKEPAEHGRAARSVRWRDKEQVVAR